MPQPSARDRFLEMLRASLVDGTLAKLTLGKHRGTDPTLHNLFVRPVALKTGPHLAFVWRHATRDVTKNHPPAEALARLEPLIGGDFLHAHLFTSSQQVQFEAEPDGSARVKVAARAGSAEGAVTPSAPAAAHDRAKSHLIPANAPWLRALGVVNERGHPREGMADKFRQIQKFAELLTHLLDEAGFGSPSADAQRIRLVDMGSGKGYLTFAMAHLLGSRAHIHGIEARRELVDLCNRIAREHGFGAHLTFSAGSIADAPLEACDVLIALHACDTATDDALARGVAAGAKLLVVAPCCQKELRAQLTPPPVLAPALRHGIFQERQAEFATDALRALLLEWVGYRTKVFEFISTEHTAKNVMIAAIKARAPAAADAPEAQRVQEFARFYGVTRQRLAATLGCDLAAR